MSTPDDPDALGDSAMASGTDAGEPGGHLGPGDLRPDEERLLAALERDVVPGSAAEDDPVAVVRAAEDEAPLPEPGGRQDDGLTPTFLPPGEE